MAKRTVADVSMICEYPEVSPVKLPELTPDRELKFMVDLMTSTTPIAKSLYRMSVEEIGSTKRRAKKATREKVHRTEYLIMEISDVVCDEEGLNDTAPH